MKMKNATTDWEVDYRYPRTREEAYGYWSEVIIDESDPPMDWQDKVVFIGCIVVSLCLVLWALV